MKELILHRNSRHQIITFKDFNQLASLTCRFLEKKNVALSGGTTFKTLFSYWKNMKVNCTNSYFFPVDERIVGFDRQASNWGTTYRDFLQFVDRSEDKKHFVISCERYKKLLKEHFKDDNPVFDVIFLGVGDDGHTASIFPGSHAALDSSSIVLQTNSPKPPYDRITLGIKVIADAKKTITIIAGENKKQVVSKILSGDKELPIVKVLSHRRQSTIFIEENLYRKR